MLKKFVVKFYRFNKVNGFGFNYTINDIVKKKKKFHTFAS